MESFEPKKLLILRIYDILNEYTNVDHKLRQNEIINLLKCNYDISCERKAVARNIEFLQQAGYDVVNDKNGIYLATRKFTDGELRLLIDSVLVNRHISKKYTKELTTKLALEGGRFFKNSVKHTILIEEWQKEDSQAYFLNIEMITEAIDNKKQIEFTYNYYGTDKKLHAKEYSQQVSPYQLLLKNGNYYLLCNFHNYDNMMFIRIDRMSKIKILDSNAKPLRTIKGYENGIELGKLSNKLPYAFDDKVERIELIAKNDGTNIIDNFVDYFGKDNFSVNVDKNGEQHFIVNASPKAMRFWILQFGKYIKVVSPQRLVEQIKDDINEMNKLYSE